MTNPTLERAARAAWCVNPLERGPFNALQYEYIARAVLMAVRGDPPLMKVEFYPSDGMYDLGRISRDGWEAMIDTILNEEAK